MDDVDDTKVDDDQDAVALDTGSSPTPHRAFQTQTPTAWKLTRTHTIKSREGDSRTGWPARAPILPVPKGGESGAAPEGNANARIGA